MIVLVGLPPSDGTHRVHDGDEINIHLPQGAHVEAELMGLMPVSEQIVTPRVCRERIRSGVWVRAASR